MISQLLTINILLLASYSDLTKKQFEKRKVPNIYFIPALFLPFFNPASIGLGITVLIGGLLLNKTIKFGKADTFALTTIALTGLGIEAIMTSLGGVLVTEKTVFRNQETFPGIPGILLGFTTYIIYLNIT